MRAGRRVVAGDVPEGGAGTRSGGAGRLARGAALLERDPDQDRGA
jgi:hypothetical protein